MTGRKSNIRPVTRTEQPQPEPADVPMPRGGSDPTWTYAGDPTVSDVAAVRFEIQDTNASAPLLWDGEISWAIIDETGLTPDDSGVQLTGGTLYAAAARCCEILARNFLMQADRTIGSLTESYSKQAANYQQMSKDFRAKASAYVGPYAGGMSESEKESWRQNTDLPRPKFTRNQFGNAYEGDWSERGNLPPMSD